MCLAYFNQSLSFVHLPYCIVFHFMNLPQFISSTVARHVDYFQVIFAIMSNAFVCLNEDTDTLRRLQKAMRLRVVESC